MVQEEHSNQWVVMKKSDFAGLSDLQIMGKVFFTLKERGMDGDARLFLKQAQFKEGEDLMRLVEQTVLVDPTS